MPRFTVVGKRTAPSAPATGAPAIDSAPPWISGWPREGANFSIDPGVWTNSPTSYTYKLYRDSALFLDVSQVLPYEGTFSSGETRKAITGTVTANNAAGSSAAEPIQIGWNFPSSVVTPSTIDSTQTLNRTTASGVTPMSFTVDAEVFDSYLWEQWIYAADGTTVIYSGMLGVSGYSLTTSLSADWSGLTDPAPQPPMPTFAALAAAAGCTEAQLSGRIRLVSGDYIPGASADAPHSGKVGPWMQWSVTDPPGYRYWKFEATTTTSAGTLIMKEFQAALAASGSNVLSGNTYYYSNGYQAGGFQSSRFFDADTGNVGSMSGTGAQWWVVDFGVNRDLHELKQLSHPSFMTVPTAWKFGPCNAPTGLTASAANSGSGPAFISIPVNRTGVSWTSGEVKTDTF